MKGTNYLQIVKSQWRLVLSIIIVVSILSFVVSIIQTPMYRTSAKVLIVQNSEVATDAYTSAKSAEQLAKTFAEVIHTNSFLGNVLKDDSNINDKFGASAWQRQEKWSKAIETEVVSDTGFLNIDTYAKTKEQSYMLATAATNVLKKSSSNYLGSANAVSFQIIDEPITYDHVAKPNIWQNIALGAMLGLFAGIILALIFPEEKSLGILFRQNNKPGENIFPDFAKSLEPAPVKDKSTSEPKEIREADYTKTGQETLPIEEVEEEASDEDKIHNWLETGRINA